MAVCANWLLQSVPSIIFLCAILFLESAKHHSQFVPGTLGGVPIDVEKK
jgi:hypothetical protein